MAACCPDGGFETAIERLDTIAASGAVTAINSAGRTALGLGDAGDWVGRPWPSLWAADARDNATVHLARALGGQATRFIAACDTPAGLDWWDVVLTPHNSGAIARCRDVTAATQRERELHRQTRHDGLTGLLNRAAIKLLIDEEVAARAGDGGIGGVMMLDLDNFKLINDTLGHDAGDAVLKAVAAGLRDALDARASVARLGGDEFAVVLPLVADHDALRATVEHLLERLGQPIDFHGRNLAARASIGVALFPKHGRNAADLLKHADIALYAAKAFGRGGYVVYVPSMGAPIRRRAATLTAARAALADGRVATVYQPMIDLRTGGLLGVEAKLRLLLPDGAVMQGLDLAPVHDDVELAVALGDLMLERLADDARGWRDAGAQVTRIAVNAATPELRSGDYAARFLARLAEVGLPATMFDVEVVETAFAGRGSDNVAAALRALSAAGVRISLDAFGTGPASLLHLKRLPVDGIKIDASFVEAIDRDAGDSAIVRAMIGLAHGFGIGLAAEGIATPAQARTLAGFGCCAGQGELYGASLPADAVAAFAGAPLIRAASH